MELKARDLLFDYYTPEEAAEALHVHPHTIRRWRTRGYGPKPVRVGVRLYYRKADITGWLQNLGQQAGR